MTKRKRRPKPDWFETPTKRKGMIGVSPCARHSVTAIILRLYIYCIRDSGGTQDTDGRKTGKILCSFDRIRKPAELFAPINRLYSIEEGDADEKITAGTPAASDPDRLRRTEHTGASGVGGDYMCPGGAGPAGPGRPPYFCGAGGLRPLPDHIYLFYLQSHG